MSNPKDTGRPPPDNDGPLLQGCNGLPDGPEPHYRGATAFRTTRKLHFRGATAFPDGPETSFQGCNGLPDDPETSFQGCNGLSRRPGTPLQGCNGNYCHLRNQKRAGILRWMSALDVIQKGTNLKQYSFNLNSQDSGKPSWLLRPSPCRQSGSGEWGADSES